MQTILLEDFRPDKWKNLSRDQKLRACQRVENYLAGESGREPYKVVSSNNILNYGSTSYRDKKIEIRLWGSDSYNSLDTIVHESRHADQYNVAAEFEKYQSEVRLILDINQIEHSIELSDKLKKHRDEAKKKSAPFFKKIENMGLEINDIIAMRWEMYHYLDSQADFWSSGNIKLYRMQLLEVDAVSAASDFLDKNQSFFNLDSKLKKELSAKEKDIEKLRKNFNDESMYTKWRQHRINKTGARPFTWTWDWDILKDICMDTGKGKSEFKCLKKILNPYSLEAAESKNETKETTQISGNRISVKELMAEGFSERESHNKKNQVIPARQSDSVKVKEIKGFRRKM